MDSAKGRVAPTKTDEFSEKFHTAYDPPSISNNHIAIFSKRALGFKPFITVQNLQDKFLDWKWPPPPMELFRNIIRFGTVTRP